MKMLQVFRVVYSWVSQETPYFSKKNEAVEFAVPKDLKFGDVETIAKKAISNSVWQPEKFKDDPVIHSITRDHWLDLYGDC